MVLGVPRASVLMAAVLHASGSCFFVPPHVLLRRGRASGGIPALIGMQLFFCPAHVRVSADLDMRSGCQRRWCVGDGLRGWRRKTGLVALQYRHHMSLDIERTVVLTTAGSLWMFALGMQLFPMFSSKHAVGGATCAPGASFYC